MGVLTERRQALLDRLRDGSFKQATGGLERVEPQLRTIPNPAGYCCLGVATVIAQEAMPDKIVRYAGSDTMYAVYTQTRATPTGLQSSGADLLPVVAEYFGFRNLGGEFSTPWITSQLLPCSSMIDLNDAGGLTFPEIADVVVARQDEIFAPDPEPHERLR